jgi:predicted DNA-binding protein
MTRNVNALLEDTQYERLRRAAFETRRPMTDILREALEDWLDHHEAREHQHEGDRP